MDKSLFRRVISFILAGVMLCSGLGGYVSDAAAQTLPTPGTMLSTSAAFTPLALKGLILDKSNPLRFHFIVDEGNTKLSDLGLKQQTNILLNYFLAALAMPEKDIWVNLAPDEQSRIIPDKLAVTEMGRDLLAQDYILKQLAASLTHPDSEAGKAYWDALNNYKLKITDYKLANGVGAAPRGRPIITSEAKQSHTAIAAPSARNDSKQLFNKIWIIPDKAVIYQDKDRVYVGESHLKVLMEQDNPAFRQHILPLIEKEVNGGKNFATLRQIFNSIILSIWFKKVLKETILYQNYADKKKTNGIADVPMSEKNKIYEQYLQALQEGAYNVLKTDRVGAYRDTPFTNKRIKRRYFSGGVAVPGEFVKNGIEVQPVNAMPEQSGTQRIITTDVVDYSERSSVPVTAQQATVTLKVDDKVVWEGVAEGKNNTLSLSQLWAIYNYKHDKARYAAVRELFTIQGMNMGDMAVQALIIVAVNDDNVFRYVLLLANHGKLDSPSALLILEFLADNAKAEQKFRKSTVLISAALVATILTPIKMDHWVDIILTLGFAGMLYMLLYFFCTRPASDNFHKVVKMVDDGLLPPIALNPVLLAKLPKGSGSRYIKWLITCGSISYTDLIKGLTFQWGFKEHQLRAWSQDISSDHAVDTINADLPVDTDNSLSRLWHDYNVGDMLKKHNAVRRLASMSTIGEKNAYATLAFLHAEGDANIFQYLLFLANYGLLKNNYLDKVYDLFVSGRESKGFDVKDRENISLLMVDIDSGKLPAVILHPLILDRVCGMNQEGRSREDNFYTRKEYLQWAVDNVPHDCSMERILKLLKDRWRFTDTVLAYCASEMGEISPSATIGQFFVEGKVSLAGGRLSGRLVAINDHKNHIDLSTIPRGSAAQRERYLASLDKYAQALPQGSAQRRFADSVIVHARAMPDLFVSDYSAKRFWGMGGNDFTVIDQNRLDDPVACFHEALESVGQKVGARKTINAIFPLLDSRARNNLGKWRNKYAASGRAAYFRANELHYYIRAFTKRYSPVQDAQTSVDIKSVGGIKVDSGAMDLQIKGNSPTLNLPSSQISLPDFNNITLRIVKVGRIDDLKDLMQNH